MPFKESLWRYKAEGMDPAVGSPQHPWPLQWWETLGWCSYILPSPRDSSRKFTGFSCSSVRCFHGLLKRENPGLPRADLHDLAKSKDRNNICVEILLREGQETMAREVVWVQGTTWGDMYLLPGNTYNYQTANRKLKIVAPNIHPIKHHYNTSTHISFLPVWHPAEVQRSGTAFPQLHFSSSNLLKSLYFLAGFQGLPLQMGFVLHCNPYSPSCPFHI